MPVLEAAASAGPCIGPIDSFHSHLELVLFLGIGDVKMCYTSSYPSKPYDMY